MTSCNDLVENKDRTGLWLGYRVGVSSSNQYRQEIFLCSPVLTCIYSVFVHWSLPLEKQTCRASYLPLSCQYKYLPKITLWPTSPSHHVFILIFLNVSFVPVNLNSCRWSKPLISAQLFSVTEEKATWINVLKDERHSLARQPATFCVFG